MKRLVIGYFGDGIWAQNCFLKIIQNPHIQIAFVVLRNERDKKLEKLAENENIPCFFKVDINSSAFIQKIQSFSPDLLVSMSFDQIFKTELLKLYPRKIINCHAGKLPFYRGRNILNWVLINDEKEFGISVHFVDSGIDTGDIILQKSYPISDKDDYTTLLKLAYKECANLLFKALLLFLKGEVKAFKQIEGGFYCPRRKKGDEFIDWSLSTREIFNFIRALNAPNLGASAFIKDKEIKLFKSKIIQDDFKNSKTGAIVQKDDKSFIVKTKDGALKVLKFKGEVKLNDKFMNHF
ncbi:methionyl-tRNA formyltransferase [Campylobacter sp. MIT 99-7217]|uniref:methionyl-tRNA formyltransferase n=1 Tax=Campylobacter sp. MIT 99-7217 TaxID=535091 RepID=UPI0011597B93|nr:methionyl-tRNA formyltransferase [Campylobacter sp. MIT 99-7217]TQR33818.1 methionyl-tRNA formyltransferase [Campylobacter sp. MIT 99-7217]